MADPSAAAVVRVQRFYEKHGVDDVSVDEMVDLAYEFDQVHVEAIERVARLMEEWGEGDYCEDLAADAEHRKHVLRAGDFDRRHGHHPCVVCFVRTLRPLGEQSQGGSDG